MISRAVLLIVILWGLPLRADDRVLFKFDTAESARAWQTVNDGVMGGRSLGRFKINDNQNMEFFGTLSLENNGGFASVRARGTRLTLNKDDVIVIRIKGDGREYNFDLYSQSDRYSYRLPFQTSFSFW
jgi:NADH dehydrogenase [ubiquinone] 1 alpha subcomplex assembly factor 1